MNYTSYYLEFYTPIHIGNGNLWDVDFAIYADTFFSALCIEALKKGGENAINDLVSSVKKNKIGISDLMPYIDDELWIRKPFLQVDKELKGDSVLKKSFKKLSYIPLNKITEYKNGELNPQEEIVKIKSLGAGNINTRAFLCEKKETLPYSIGTYQFAPNRGLYFIAGFTDEAEKKKLEVLLDGLGCVGIGGKTSSGLGKFYYEERPLESSIISKLKGGNKSVITLSTSLPQETEMEKVLIDAKYKLIKRSGFIQSSTYAETVQKKRDIYMFQSGSFFQYRFEGDIFDVATFGNHPVYRYGKPMFLEV